MQKKAIIASLRIFLFNDFFLTQSLVSSIKNYHTKLPQNHPPKSIEKSKNTNQNLAQSSKT